MLIKGTKASKKNEHLVTEAPVFFFLREGASVPIASTAYLQILSLTSAVYPEPSLASGSHPLSKSSLTRLTLPSNAACQIPLSKSISVNDCAHDKGFDEQPQAFSCSQEWSISAVIK